MQIKTPCCKLYLQQGAEKQIEQLSVSFIRTIPSAPESHRISGCINSRSRACGNAIYRRWGIAPRPEDPDSIEASILPDGMPVNSLFSIFHKGRAGGNRFFCGIFSCPRTVFVIG